MNSDHLKGKVYQNEVICRRNVNVSLKFLPDVVDGLFTISAENQSGRYPLRVTVYVDEAQLKYLIDKMQDAVIALEDQRNREKV